MGGIEYSSRIAALTYIFILLYFILFYVLLSLKIVLRLCCSSCDKYVSYAT